MSTTKPLIVSGFFFCLNKKQLRPHISAASISSHILLLLSVLPLSFGSCLLLLGLADIFENRVLQIKLHVTFC